MAPPLAADNFAQKQEITTTIKNICQYYPPNTCLRELLQNADDAGATEIEYVLDPNIYNDEPLLSDGLKGFQGPALLARNNSVFRDEDFGSLSSVGDSVKAKDPASTGKFGQGFNAVYHWTDGPWIYSRNWLLLLDPHEWWSRETGQAGGPRWNVVENCDSIEIQNHVKAFDTFSFDWHQPLDQTFIRVPLRTAAQAEISKIFQVKIEVPEIRQALEEFGQEIKEGGLLFLKHIRKVIIRIDAETIFDAEILENSDEDAKTRRNLPTDFQGLYATHPPSVQKDIYPFVEFAIRYTEAETSDIYRYAVQHIMLRDSGDPDLDAWAREQKLFPWAAVAAQLKNQSDSKSAPGRLFTSLRLPMSTNLPIHVHGLFSIAPDRGRLSFTRGSNDAPTQWNSFMFTKCVALAWLKLLSRRNTNSFREEMFAFWPRPNFNPVEMWDRLDDQVIDSAIKFKSQVWNTCDGRCVEFDKALFAANDGEEAKYISALAQTNIPAVFVHQPFFRKIQERAYALPRNMKMLSPGLVRPLLRSQGLPLVSEDAISLILEFCLLDAINSKLAGKLRENLYHDLHDIPFWPTADGKISKSGSTVLLLPRDDSEMRLFAMSRATITLDISKLRPRVRKLLLTDIQNLTGVLRLRGLDDLMTDWPVMYPVIINKPSENWVLRPSTHEVLLHDTWIWICNRTREGQRMSLKRSGSLFLVPMNECRVRQYAPHVKDDPILFVEQHEPLFRVVARIISHGPIAAPPILDTEVLSREVLQLLRSNRTIRSEFNCTCVDDAEAFVDWLVVGKAALSQATEEDRLSLLSHLQPHINDYTFRGGIPATFRLQMRRLPLYKKISCVPPFRHRSYVRSSLDGSGHLYMAPVDLPPLPDIPQASFFLPQSPAESLVVECLKVLEVVSNKDLLTRHLLPWMANVPSNVEDVLSLAKNALVNWLTAKSLPYSEEWQTDVFSQPIIPLPVQDGQRQYRCLSGMIDPKSALAPLYDPEESRFPCPEFYATHHGALVSYGLLSQPVWSTPLERIRYLSQHRERIGVSKVEGILKLPVQLEFSNSDVTVREIRDLKWLPGKSITGQSVILAPSECRGVDESYLVDKVLPTTAISVQSNKWKEVLGWNKRISTDILLQQLDGYLSEKRYQKASAVLLHLHPEDCPALLSRSWILGRSGDYFPPAKVFLPGSRLKRRPLAPYLDEVDGGFAKAHYNLLIASEVRSGPSIEDLQKVQSSLLEISQERLSPSNLQMAVSILEIAVCQGYDSADLLIPDTTCKFQKLSDIVHGEPFGIGDQSGFNFTHREVSDDLARQLGLEKPLERAIRLDIDLGSEDDEVDYTPSESLETVISDTLERYAVADTFNEFLANADDAAATKISWILDGCSEGLHAASSLLTTELKPFQGPALLVYNDGVFSEKDFSGFKDIGRGGKKGDATSTGMFGRGALSMYHLTDVPMLISNDSFLVLDPQQQVLPVDYRRHRKRRVGTKMSLSAMNRHAPDQLAPFVGLNGFDRDADHYQGTMFRFPLRLRGDKTSLKENSETVDFSIVRSLLGEYFATARTALLFLRHVSTIEFRIKGCPEPQWTVSAKRFRYGDDDTYQRIEITTCRSSFETLIDTWCVASEAIVHLPAGITRSGRGSEKLTECGIATCLIEGQVDQARPGGGVSLPKQSLSTTLLSTRQSVIQQKVFCRLPTTHKSSLPISFHASFAVTGDRRNIALEAGADNSSWNHWLLEDRLPALYLRSLRHLASKLGQETFSFWPAKDPSNSLSGLLSQAFWEKFANQLPRITGVLPLLTQNNQPDKKSRERLLEVSQRTTDLIAARFDFLPDVASDMLRPLLEKTSPFLVRPPRNLWPSFNSPTMKQHTQEVDAEYLSSIFKIEGYCKLLEDLITQLADEKKQRGLMSTLLNLLIPDVRGQGTMSLSMLDKCRIVPRPHLNMPLGTLFWKAGPSAPQNLVVTSEEEKLFAFAADSMVHAGLFPRPIGMSTIGNQTHHDPIDILLKSDFNIRQLDVSDLRSLLARPDSPIRSPADADNLDIWIVEFWVYLNHHLHPALGENVGTLLATLAKNGLDDQKIYRVHSNGVWFYLTPQQFEAQPCVMQPLDPQHQRICKAIPGLSMIDRKCAPSVLQTQEPDLKAGVSFKRLLRAFGQLERIDNTTAKTFIGRALDPELKDVLKNLVISFLNSSHQADPSHIAMLRQLPIWRRSQSSSFTPHEHISTEDATFCGHDRMLMPWVRSLSSFVKPDVVNSHKRALSRLQVSPLTHEQAWNVIKGDLPVEVKSAIVRQQYLDLIRYLATCNFKLTGRVAPNGASVMCATNTLYDHDDVIFRAAFRERKQTHFLHMDMQTSVPRTFWLSLGLRARGSGGVMYHEYFLECVLALAQRWDSARTSPSFEEDSRTVVSYLRFDNDHFRSWPGTVWATVASIPLFKVRDVPTTESLYRRTRMQDLAQEMTHRALTDSTHVNRKRIVWSQSSFLQEQPGDFVYVTLPRSGKPTVTTVFNHLVFLIGIIKDVVQEDVSEYLRDVQASYAYLQENLDNTKLIPGIYRAKMWLNLDTTQVELVVQVNLKTSLTSANLLCLNSPVDPLPVKVARKFLVPYEKLLMGLGCKTVMQPTSASPPQSSDSRELSLTAAMAQMRKLRDRDKLVDVYFEAQGQKKPAHKVVLAAVSEYCEKQFAGPWGRILAHQATIHLDDISFLTLSQMIDFAYTGDFALPELKDASDNVEIGDTLAMLLDLLDGTDRWLLQRLHDITDNFLTSLPYSAIYIRVDTVEWVKERAESARALRLVKHCEDFFKSNEEFVVALREG